MMTRADLFRSQYQSTLAREETRGMFDEAANNIEDLKKMVLNAKKMTWPIPSTMFGVT